MLSKEENSRNIKVLEDTCQSLRKLLDELFQEREKRLMVLYKKFIIHLKY